MKWEKDKDGDWSFYDGEEYIGMLCPHMKAIQCIVDGLSLVGSPTNTLKANKKWMEKWWRIKKKVRTYEDKLMKDIS